MAKTIQVTPEQLETTAGKIEGLAKEYETQYNQLYAETNAMASTWSGKDNVAFVERIDGFKDDFKNMHTLMNNYADFLRKSAKAYRDTQDTIVKDAQNLIN